MDAIKKGSLENYKEVFYTFMSARLDSNIVATITGVACTLLCTLLLGGYAYTWTIADKEDQEKQVWREHHLDSLDKRFAEVRQNQDKLISTVDTNMASMRDLLRQMVQEQERANQFRQDEQRFQNYKEHRER